MRASILFSALGANVLLVGAGTGERLQFAPAAGTSLSKSFLSAGEFALDEMSLEADGQDVGAMLGSLEVGMETSTRVEVTDVYKAVGEGRPRELLRTYDTLESRTKMSMSQMEAIPEVEATSELAGRTVRFLWNEESDDYDVSFHESDGDASLLDGLEEEMDLRFFLPTEEVAVDGSWKVELTALEPLVMPGGNLRMMPADAAMDPEAMAVMEGLMETFSQKVGDQLEGNCVCTFKGMREGSESRLAEIEIEIDITASLDLREFLQQAIQTGLAQSGQDFEIEFDISQADVTADYEGAGTLLWDTAAGRLHSLGLHGDLNLGFDIDVSLDAMGESHSMQASMEMSGEWRHEVTAGE